MGARDRGRGSRACRRCRRLPSWKWAWRSPRPHVAAALVGICGVDSYDARPPSAVTDSRSRSGRSDLHAEGGPQWCCRRTARNWSTSPRSSRTCVRCQRSRREPIPGSESPAGVVAPAFSPDGQSIAFRNTQDTFEAPVAQWRVRPSRSARSNSPTASAGMRTRLSGRSRTRASCAFHQTAAFPKSSRRRTQMKSSMDRSCLPGGRAVMFAVRQDHRHLGSRANRRATASGRRARKTLINGGSDARYLPTGHIAYA